MLLRHRASPKWGLAHGRITQAKVLPQIHLRKTLSRLNLIISINNILHQNCGNHSQVPARTKYIHLPEPKGDSLQNIRTTRDRILPQVHLRQPCVDVNKLQ